MLVTGGLGFVGSNLAIRLVELGAEMLLVDSMLRAYRGDLARIEPVRDPYSLAYLVKRQERRLDELQAAILRVRLARLAGALERRRALARAYRERLEGSPALLPAEGAGERHAWHLYVVRVPERDRVARALETAGIGTGVHYPEPAHRMAAYRFLGYAAGDLPATEQACCEVLSLPLHPSLGEGDVDRVAAALRAAL